jgi:iron complex outermembrane receptor protein
MKHLIIVSLLFVTSIFAQNITVSGTIKDAKTGRTLAMANVLVQGTSNGTVSDVEGNFTLSKLKKSDLLVFSFIGYKSKTETVASLINNNVVYLLPKAFTSQQIIVEAMNGEKGETPASFDEVTRTSLKQNYVNQSVPEFISYLPSTTFYSESGGTVGYTYLNIRGFGQRRISISVNGIPQNDPEDNNVYWVDMPDILSSTGLIQVQRGAGNGMVGYPAIGGSINIITSPFSDKRDFSINAQAGSYNLRKYSAAFSSGLIDNKYSLYVKLGQTLQSGYRDLSWVNYKSYNVSAVRYDKNFTTQINLYGGPITDGLAYYGLPKNVIGNREERRANYSWWDYDYTNGKYYSWSVKRRPEEREYYSQPHYELLNEWTPAKNITINSALFLIIGNGNFDFDGSWADTTTLRLTSEYGFHPTQNPTNTLIRAEVDNQQIGWIPRIKWTHENGRLIAGGEVRLHNSVHWGSVLYGSGLPEGLSPEHRFYYYEGGKNIYTFFLNENYNISDKLNIMAELQIASHKYKIEKEKYLANNFTVSGTYLNPRAALNYRITDNLNTYISFARVTREPRLKNYYEAEGSYYGTTPQFGRNGDGTFDYSNPLVKPETMNDFESGISFSNEKIFLSTNVYYMLFDNEIVKNGQVGIFGDPVTGNMKRTVHAGVEFTAKLRIDDFIDVTINGSYSDNYISEGKHYVSSTDFIDLSGNQLGGFPNMLGNAALSLHKDGLYGTVLFKYVGKYYSDNFADKLEDYIKTNPALVSYDDNVVDAYYVVNLIGSYQFELSGIFPKVKVYGQINNMFDKLYAGYAVGKEFFPAAERNFVFGVSLGL